MKFCGKEQLCSLQNINKGRSSEWYNWTGQITLLSYVHFYCQNELQKF